MSEYIVCKTDFELSKTCTNVRKVGSSGWVFLAIKIGEAADKSLPEKRDMAGGGRGRPLQFLGFGMALPYGWKNMSKDFNAIALGETYVLLEKFCAPEERKFVDMTGDYTPPEVHRVYAETTSFKGAVMQCMLGVSCIMTVTGTEPLGTDALWAAQNRAFMLPVRVCEELTISCQAPEQCEQERPLELNTRIVNLADGGCVIAANGGMVMR